MDAMKDGLTMKEKITQKNPAKETKVGQKTAPSKEAANSDGKPGKFTFKQ